MDEEYYAQYIAKVRALIENHGAKNDVYVFEKALMLELREEGLFDKERKRITLASHLTKKMYYRLEKL